MKIFVLGLMFSEESLEKAYKHSKCGVQIAPHVFQRNLISGFENLQDVDLTVLNIIPIGSYPKRYKKLFIKEKTWGKNNVEIGFVNLPIVKRQIQKTRILKHIENYINKNGPNDVCILMYHVFKPFLQIANKLKKKYPEIKISMIMTDPIPGRGSRAKYMNKKGIKQGDELVTLSNKCVDAFVLLTKHMSEPVEVGARPYVVVECISNPKQKKAVEKSNSKNICLYTGAVNKEYGICDLAEAFSMMDNAQLWICGGGDAHEYLKEMSKNHENIKYFAFLDQDKVAFLRDKCDFLINPRRPSGTFTKYSFPSKTAEYMASGKPVIMYKLEGVLDEYDEYLNYLTSNDSEGIRKELLEIFSRDYSEYTKKSAAGRDFIIERKSPTSQAEKIVNMLRKL